MEEVIFDFFFYIVLYEDFFFLLFLVLNYRIFFCIRVLK